jgi:hypothetical protein
MANDTATETLYPGESFGSHNLKLVRRARTYRGMAITHPDAHIAMVGYLAGSHLLRDTNAFRVQVDRMIDQLVDVRDTLVSLGIVKTALIGYFPYQVAPITANLIVLTARHTRANPVFPGYSFVPPSAVPGPAFQDDGPKGLVIIDPFAEPHAVRANRTVETQLEITVWDDKGIGKKLPGPMKLSVSVGPNGFEEMGGELTLLKQQLRNQMLFGVLNKVVISLKAGGTLNFDNSTAQRLMGDWSAKLKSSLEFDIHIPKTSLTIVVEGTLGVDHTGKPSPELKATVFEF